MLTRETMTGPWAGLPVAWSDDDTFDEKAYRINVANCCKVNVPGVYTGGTTGKILRDGVGRVQGRRAGDRRRVQKMG